MRGLRGQEVKHYTAEQTFRFKFISLKCQSCHFLQGDRGPKGLKGLKGATGHKVKTSDHAKIAKASAHLSPTPPHIFKGNIALFLCKF